jgi:predicted Zn-dependent peptidase
MITKSTLQNGIRVISETIPHSHSVAIGIWVTNGSRHDSREINGVAHFIEHLLFKGTVKRSALDIAREIDSVGGVLNAFTCREYVCYYAKVLDDSLPKAVDLLSDIFLNSSFDPAEIEKERKVVLQEIRMLKDSPDSYIHELFCQSFWKSHPLGMSIAGTEESVNRLSRDVLLNNRK